ncbi:Smr/MutS family protein [Rhizobium sp. KVB221]|uniref:Smr/MutS family protein n=1 Tax=Rhizobium setariae TaxID=2801340 RepID=A0A936YSQ8_9HYPH|nr:Smr/MutS family protein [Rhizobium setariae]MBL0374162.1 Smr/MutS family protein [Rhizobium setariae]
MRGGKRLTDEDRILWGKVARSTRALPGRMEDIEAFEIELLEGREEVAAAMPAAAIQPEQVRKPEKKPPGQHQPLERPVKRKLSKGRLQLEARIDLHGMFQSEAHSLLLGFIVRAYERGLRHVLVITGKGSSLGSDGALKRAVPMWFGKPEFRHMISSYETSAQNHGGEGALYVRLAKRGDRP